MGILCSVSLELQPSNDLKMSIALLLIYIIQPELQMIENMG
jgi:hypothetical protein